jgi:hypothetical protein
VGFEPAQGVSDERRWPRQRAALPAGDGAANGAVPSLYCSTDDGMTERTHAGVIVSSDPACAR